MPIAPNPKRHRSGVGTKPLDAAVKEFVNGADAESQGKVSIRDRDRKTQVLVRIDPSLLERADAAAMDRGISRSAWISLAISGALKAAGE